MTIIRRDDSQISATRSLSPRGRLPNGQSNPIDVYIGTRIRHMRTMRGLSQEALGLRLGLTFQQVQKYERGANRVGASRLYDLSQILDVPVAFFFDCMPEDVANSSPAAVAAGQAPITELPETNPEFRPQIASLVKHFSSIANPAAQASIMRLVRTLSTVDEG